MEASIYRELSERTKGKIYVGVVGPVRTGKSTFIKRFMETLVLPNIQDIYVRERAKDELPQCGSGRTIMTAEPKFIPEQAAELRLDDNTVCSVRLVDSVGFMVNGAMGNTENGSERMVMTPWYEEEIPMSRAAEEGTRRVICDHATVGLLVTTDGSFSGLERAEYEPPEARAVQELQAAGKPYLILLNCADPNSETSLALAEELSERYGHSCMAVNCAALTEAELRTILSRLLDEFPVLCYSVNLPAWTDALDYHSEVKRSLYAAIREAAERCDTMGKASKHLAEQIAADESIQNVFLTEKDPGQGQIRLSIELPQQLYYSTMSAESGFEIRNDRDLMLLLHSVSSLKTEYERVHQALEDVRTRGYGIVMPTLEEMRLEEPQIVRQGGRYGVKLKASAPSIHMIMANIETEVSPAIGGEKASEEVINFLLQGYDGDINRIWESNIFGKALNDIAGEGLTGKIRSMPEDAKTKLQHTIQRIINEGEGGLICILL